MYQKLPATLSTVIGWPPERAGARLPVRVGSHRGAILSSPRGGMQTSPSTDHREAPGGPSRLLARLIASLARLKTVNEY
jgi:hypothetical protein